MIDLTSKFEHYRLRFRSAMDARNLTNEALAERIGSHPVTVSKLRRGKIRLDDEWRAKTAMGLAIPEAVLFGEGPLPDPKPAEIYVSPKKAARMTARRAANDNLIPLYGLAAGSLQGAHSMSNDPVDEVPCPPGLRDAAGAYALLTHGESMIPRFLPGERLYVNPNQRVRLGDHVIIQTRIHDNSGTETWVKRYDGDDRDSILVWQYNPPARVKFNKKYVMHMHRVMTINELF